MDGVTWNQSLVCGLDRQLCICRCFQVNFLMPAGFLHSQAVPQQQHSGDKGRRRGRGCLTHSLDMFKPSAGWHSGITPLAERVLILSLLCLCRVCTLSRVWGFPCSRHPGKSLHPVHCVPGIKSGPPECLYCSGNGSSNPQSPNHHSVKPKQCVCVRPSPNVSNQFNSIYFYLASFTIESSQCALHGCVVVHET